MQEVITLVVFACFSVLYLKEPLHGITRSALPASRSARFLFFTNGGEGLVSGIRSKPRNSGRRWRSRNGHLHHLKLSGPTNAPFESSGLTQNSEQGD
jgi:hypothetical protein